MKDRRYRACWNASAAVDAFDRVNVELGGGRKSRLVFSGMNAIARTYIDTGCVFRPRAGFCNNVSHRYLRGGQGYSRLAARLEDKEYWTNATMTYVTEMGEMLGENLLVLADFVSQDRRVWD